MKLHPFLRGSGNFDGFRHIRTFPAQWDTYEGLSLCSTLITDYSSVFYDFANAGKQIILFAYDRKEYENGRGMYEDIGKYPFLYTEDAAEVTEEEPAVIRSVLPPEVKFVFYLDAEDGDAACRVYGCHICLKGESLPGPL